ncbi:DUF499 domain-containing protein [Tautonia rosea]|uniref:DUF499 domain-containing protein n=1 Tax=Tautonia rosea TaxID=2728037 RepID=UPI001472938B|nr:DUF499 domain-containing protein [Tautonia rosea]
MPNLPSVFQQCTPRPEVLAGELPDSIFAADLWDVVCRKPGTHPDYLDPIQFFGSTHPTENLKLLIRDVTERLAGVEGGTPVYRLETGFGGGKTHSLIGTTHAAREGERLADQLQDFRIGRFPAPDAVRVAAFVGEESDPLSGNEHVVSGEKIRTFTPWGQIAALVGGKEGYEEVRANDEQGVAPAREALERAFADHPVLIVIDELVLYMARAFALKEDQPRSRVNSQWPTFLQTLFKLATQRPRTVVILTLPSEQDANRKLTGELKQHIPTVLDTVDELSNTAGRQARNLTPTQSNERAAVLGRRLFERVSTDLAGDVASAFVAYYEAQQRAGVALDGRAFEPDYAEQIRAGYPFHPELIRLFAERLADIPDFQATRGALRLVARTIRAAWDRKAEFPDTLLLQPYHIDLARGEMQDEVLSRLSRTAFARGLEADVVRPEGGTHASQAEAGWPWKAATEASLVTFLHSLPDGSKGITGPEAALALGRPGVDLAYVPKGLEETERRAWYMRREGDHYLFRTRASINKRYQERLAELQQQPAEVKRVLDDWIKEVYSGFTAFQLVPFPSDHTAINDNPDRIRLALIHYDKEVGFVGPGAGERLNFVKTLFTKTGVNAGPRTYRNNLVFLLAEGTRVQGLKDAVKSLMAWERVQADIEQEQANLAQAGGSTYTEMKRRAGAGATGVPAEFMALEDDLARVREQLGPQELNVRTKLLEAYRVLAFPRGGESDSSDLFASSASASMLECFRVDFGETPERGGRHNERRAVAEAPLLQCLRQNNKLVPEATASDPLVLAPDLIRQAPLWQDGERCLSTEEVWERLRREPELPMVLRQTDLLPSLRAGLTATPDALWAYYDRATKKVYTRAEAADLSPVIGAQHLLYDIAAAAADRILPVREIRPQELWDHLWPKEGTSPAPTVTAPRLLEAAKASAHYPVLPDRAVLWQAIQEGTRENRWVLYQRGPNLAIGAQEMNEWPGTPRFEDSVEFWTYQAALDQGIYPRKKKPDDGEPGPESLPLTPANVRERCWPANTPELSTEDLERYARNVWADLTRPRLETALRDGVRDGTWAAWRKGDDETYFIRDDSPGPQIVVGPAWSLVDPASPLAHELDDLRPGRGPQPVVQVGTPREALTAAWDALAAARNVRIAELDLSVEDRESFDNTLRVAWADRPKAAQVHATLVANGQRVVEGKTEAVNVTYEGRFEALRDLLAPLWPFRGGQGELQVTITVGLKFADPPAVDDAALCAFRDAMMNAGQGQMEVRLVPVRPRRAGDA